MDKLKIKIEGIPGAGKTIMAEYLAAMLGAAGFCNVTINDKIRSPEEQPKGHKISLLTDREVTIETVVRRRT